MFVLSCPWPFVILYHAKKAFIDSVYDKVDQHTNQVLNQIKVEKPIEVIPPSVDTNIYKVLYLGMKKIQIQISDEAHLELLTEQLERKKNKKPRITLIDVASDIFEELIQERISKQKATQK